MSEAAGADSWTALLIGSATPEADLAGVPLTTAEQTTRDDERKAAADAADGDSDADAESADRVFGSIMAVGAALALLQ